MSSQIQITGETKVKSLTGVLVGTSGVVSSLNIDGSLGIPQLDVNGKIIVSQLPNSVMEYKGTWSAATNTPTLANGTGNQGDVYLCNVAGTVDFGAGPIAFFVGDQVIYSGSIWQRASGATGTVTSVAITESGDSLNITGSPITTSGTINIGFNGTNLQYVNGAGNLTTFPILTGYVTAVSGTAPVISSGGTTPAISMAAATGSVDGYLLATDFAIFSAKQSALTFSSPLVNTSGTISIPAATTSVNGYLASADFTTFNNKQNAITLTTTGTSGASTLVGATLNIPNYGSALTGYVPYTGATQDVDLGAFKLNAQSLHIKGTAGNGHLGLKHQSASATASANEVSLFADSLGDLSWQNGNLYLSKFITSGNTAARSYTFPNANGTVALTSDLANYVDLTTAQTIGGTKTFSDATKNNGGIFLQNASSGSLAGYMNIGGLTNGVKFTSGGGISNTFTLPSATGYTFTFPNATGTIALTSDISYPVTSVFGRTGAVVATSGDYTTAQVTEVTNLYFTDTRARLALSFVAGSGAYNNTTGVITIPTNNNQITNGAGYTTNVGTVTSVAATGGTGISITGSPITTSGTITITNTAPDQTVALTASTGISVTGTYPNFTITNTSPSSGGTVTSVAALTLGTTGTDLSSTVANSTTTPVITLNVPTASAANRGALSSADWTTFNSKQGTITLTTTGTSGAATFTSNTLNIPNYGSALSGYLPLTGGTLTGPLTGTTATLISGVGAALSFKFSAGYGNSYIYTTWDSGSNIGNEMTFAVNNAAGTGVVALQLFGTGAATFSSSIIFANNSSALCYGSSSSRFFVYNGINTYIGDIDSYAPSASLILRVNGSDRLTITSTGAATFSSSVTATNILTGNSGINVSGYGYLTQTVSGQMTILGHNVKANTSVTNQVDVVNSGWYSSMIKQYYNEGITFHTSDTVYSAGAVYPFAATERMRITSGGNVLIGTTNDNGQKLQVKGNARFNYSDDFGYFGLGYVSGADYGFYNYNYSRIDLKITQSTGEATFSNLAGTGTRVVEASSAGLLSATKILDEGTYTPTKSGGSGSWTSISMGDANWTRVGNRVTVWGNINATSVSGVSNQDFYITLPITSTNSTGGLLIGNDGVIGGIINNGNMQGFQWSTTQFYIILQSDGLYTHQFTYTYTYLI